MNQDERLAYLVDELCKENIKYRHLKIEKEERRIVMRSLMNIRIPKPISAEFLKVQDEYLKEEALQKGIVKLHDIPTIKKKYGYTARFADKISIWQGDITTLEVEAIVNAANREMLGCFVPGHRCIDNAIHSAAGVQLREACNHYMQYKRESDRTYFEATGTAVITSAYNLPCQYIIHTVGPIVSDSLTDSLRDDLRKCYQSCLEEAVKHNIQSIAFCCISTGEFCFPNKEAAEIAIQTVEAFLEQHENRINRVIFNVFKSLDLAIYEELFYEEL